MDADTFAKNDFSRFDTKRLKALYNASRTVGTLCILWALGALLFLILVVVALVGKDKESMNQIATSLVVLIPLGALKVGALIGCLKQAEWGRVLGIIDCILMLLGFPIGTLIGIIGLVALIPNKELFEPNALDFKALKAEYKLRKQLLKSGTVPPPIR